MGMLVKGVWHDVWYDTSASGGAATAISSVAAEPAMKEPIAAMPSAGPARPCRAIW